MLCGVWGLAALPSQPAVAVCTVYALCALNYTPPVYSSSAFYKKLP